MESLEFEKYYKLRMDFYYGTKKIIILNYYKIFGFVDVKHAENNDGGIFSLPISVLTIGERKVQSIYINRIYDMSVF